ncbi:hypothetical protein BD779DRAFT_1476285 [Infundibulicybe gibba]|nr:hypothetical protein BD779DRAFT_1476285 [Infundibulicybe gibba]
MRRCAWMEMAVAGMTGSGGPAPGCIVVAVVAGVPLLLPQPRTRSQGQRMEGKRNGGFITAATAASDFPAAGHTRANGIAPNVLHPHAGYFVGIRIFAAFVYIVKGRLRLNSSIPIARISSTFLAYTSTARNAALTASKLSFLKITQQTLECRASVRQRILEGSAAERKSDTRVDNDTSAYPSHCIHQENYKRPLWPFYALPKGRKAEKGVRGYPLPKSGPFTCQGESSLAEWPKLMSKGPRVHEKGGKKAGWCKVDGIAPFVPVPLSPPRHTITGVVDDICGPWEIVGRHGGLLLSINEKKKQLRNNGHVPQQPSRRLGAG